MNIEKYLLEKYKIKPDKNGRVDLPISRWKEFPALLKEAGFKTGAEIGILKGEYTETLCRQDIKMYGIDSWTYYGNYSDYSADKYGKYEENARNRLGNEKYDCTIMKGWSMEAVDKFEDESLDFVFIDGNHAIEFVIEDIAAWSKKVKKGGIVAGHDYFRLKGRHLLHAKDAVDAWTYCYKINPWFVMRNDKCPSWFYVKK